MGINITIYKVLGQDVDDSPGGPPLPFLVTEKPGWWDSGRHAGDKEFASGCEFTTVEKFDVDYEHAHLRPTNFNACRKWIKENVPHGNQQRLWFALDKMELDKSLVFRFSR